MSQPDSREPPTAADVVELVRVRNGVEVVLGRLVPPEVRANGEAFLRVLNNLIGTLTGREVPSAVRQQ